MMTKRRPRSSPAREHLLSTRLKINLKQKRRKKAQLTCPVRRLERVPRPVHAVGGVAAGRRGGLRVRHLGDEHERRRGEEDGRGDARAHDGDSGDGHLSVVPERARWRKGGGRRETGESSMEEVEKVCSSVKVFFFSLSFFPRPPLSSLSLALFLRFLFFFPGTDGGRLHTRTQLEREARDPHTK